MRACACAQACVRAVCLCLRLGDCVWVTVTVPVSAPHLPIHLARVWQDPCVPLGALHPRRDTLHTIDSDTVCVCVCVCVCLLGPTHKFRNFRLWTQGGLGQRGPKLSLNFTEWC